MREGTLTGGAAVVTGGCGFIGTNLVKELRRLGVDVAVVDLPSADWSRVPEGVRRVKADILRQRQLEDAFAGAQVVYHLAARTDLDGRSLDAYSVNTDGTRNVIRACADAGSVDRFVFYSTQLVVGLFNHRRFLNETEPYRSRTYYGLSKIEGERIVRDECSNAGMPYTTIRPTSVYGPWGEEPFKSYFAAIKRGRYFHIGKAENLVSWVYVQNLIDLTVLAATSPKAEGETYFGNDLYPYTMRQIGEIVAQYYGNRLRNLPSPMVTAAAYALGLARAAGVDVPLYPFRLQNLKATYCYDMQKAIDLGYRPRYRLEDGLRITLDWYENNRQF